MSHYNYPQDEFDVSDDGAPMPIGVHRAELPAWRAWLPLIAVVVAAVFLAWLVVSFLGHRSGSAQDDSLQSEVQATALATASATQSSVASAPATQATAAASEAATTATTVDYSTSISVLNGTGVTGLAGRTGEKLQQAGFTAVNVPAGVYGYSAPTVTTIYYASAAQQEAAQAAGDALGITNLVEMSSATNSITIVLRSDYSG